MEICVIGFNSTVFVEILGAEGTTLDRSWIKLAGGFVEVMLRSGSFFKRDEHKI